MEALVRPARADDLAALYELAKLAGEGFTNLPADRAALAARLDRSSAALAGERGEDHFILMLEVDGRVGGTAQVMGRVGTDRPFYSYRRGILTQHSAELGRAFRAETLTLCTDLEHSSEVGGLFLHPRHRAGGLGLLLARARYLFVRAHRARFADRILAELRGVIDEAGVSPFWDGIAGRFFGMGFREADEANVRHGRQFFADYMPKHPVYLAMLPDAARAVVGVPHPGGRAAMRMLEAEGFAGGDYLDIFDGGPTMLAVTDRVRTIRDAQEVVLAAVADGGPPAIVAAGRLADFRATLGRMAEDALDPAAARRLGVSPGDTILHAAR